jgi:hypothetical protein
VIRRIAAFAVVLGVIASACGASAGAGTSGIRGLVLLGPQCPVVQQGSPCPDTPFEGTVAVTDLSGRLVGTTRSGADGRFEIRLDPGTYLLQAIDLQGVTFSKPVTMEVTAGHMNDATVLVDTGIREPTTDPSGGYGY